MDYSIVNPDVLYYMAQTFRNSTAHFIACISSRMHSSMDRIWRQYLTFLRDMSLQYSPCILSCRCLFTMSCLF